MSEESQNSEDYIKDIIQESGIAEPQKDEQRVSKILSQARRKVGTRDFIVLIFVRFWIILAEITCKIFARHSTDTETNPKNSRSNLDEKVNPKE